MLQSFYLPQRWVQQENYDGDAQGDAGNSDDENDGVLDEEDAAVVIDGCNSGVLMCKFPAAAA